MNVDENKSTPQQGEGEYPSNAIAGRCLGTSASAPRQSISVESGSGVHQEVVMQQLQHLPETIIWQGYNI
jgi:hypothetical protein